MPIFALNIIEVFPNNQVEKLIINGKCQLDEFEEDAKKNKRNRSELGTIYRYIQYELEGNKLPESHKKELNGFKLTVSEYRSKHLRIYTIKKQNGQVLILGGYKKNQTKDLRKIASITNQLYQNPL